MSRNENRQWLSSALPKHQNLSSAVENIVRNLLNAKGIDFLTVSSRTKDIEGCLEKINRKGYRNPTAQLTDISGVRIVVYFESNISLVSRLIEEAFHIDMENSLDQDSLLSANQLGYRSVHYVCDLGEQRAALPEFQELQGLKFEIQIRTVLQHAWAELAHDRNYKFSGALPRVIERKLYLYAGMLEIADRGFSELSAEIDAYIAQVGSDTKIGKLSIEVNSLSLEEFVHQWSEENKYRLGSSKSKGDFSDLVRELNEFGVTTLDQVKDIIPQDYAKVSKKHRRYTNIYGIVRDWMMIADPERFVADVKIAWMLGQSDVDFIRNFLPKERVYLLTTTIGVFDDTDYPPGENDA